MNSPRYKKGDYSHQLKINKLHQTFKNSNKPLDRHFFSINLSQDQIVHINVHKIM